MKSRAEVNKILQGDDTTIDFVILRLELVDILTTINDLRSEVTSLSSDFIQMAETANLYRQRLEEPVG